MKSRCALKPQDNSSGFTLMELMLVVSILAVLSVIAFPRFQNLFITPKDADQVEALKEVIISLRNNVITADSCGVLSVVSNNTISAQVFRQCGPPLAQPQPIRTVSFTNLTFGQFSTGPDLQFNPGGGTDKNNPSVMTIVTSTNNEYSLTVLPAIGVVRLKKTK